MNYTIENDRIRVTVSTNGAELQSLFDKKSSTEYMWNGNPELWGKKSPVLFPVVGTLKSNTYFYNHKSYNMNRHGFAREKDFELKEQSETSLLFCIKNDESTLAIYPFEFEFSILYSIHHQELSVTYIVKNTGDDDLLFSVGGHPAFKVPIFEGDTYNDYILKFNQKETIGRWPISKDGLIERTPTPLLIDSDTIHLKKELFYKDAIVLKNLKSQSVKLLSTNNNCGIGFNFASFPYLGIWAAKDADFVCIEPWCGIADGIDSNQVLVDKEGINQLSAKCLWERKWTVSIID